MAFGGGSFTTNCLDDIPFKLGPKFKVPTKVILPQDIQHISKPKALAAEYTFEVEEAVLKWSAEKERQRLESEAAKLRPQVTVNENAEHSSDDEDQPIYENTNNVQQPIYENPSILIPQPAPRPALRPKPNNDYVNTILPNPLIANISNDILQPTQSYSSDENESEKTNEAGKKTTNNIDLRWFEKEDDPFDNLELQTINVMDELASVLQETKKSSPVPPVVVENDQSSTDPVNGTGLTNGQASQAMNIFDNEQNVNTDNNEETRSESPEYENVDLKLMELKVGIPVNSGQVKPNSSPNQSSLGNLPPVPPRRDLVGNQQPLPPIGHSTSEPSFSESKNMNFVNNSASIDSMNEQMGQSQSQTSVKTPFQSVQDGSKVMSNRRAALPKPPRTFTYSRHEFDDGAEFNDSEPKYENPNTPQISVGNDLNVQFTNSDRSSKSSETAVKNSSEELNFVQHHFSKDVGSSSDTTKPRSSPRRPPAPPPRPSSQQTWNRYSPLPPTGSGPGTDQSGSESEPSSSPREDTTHVALYNQLSLEAQSSVDKLVSMGFPKDRVVRAVDKLGRDEKEIVEYLCLVDQLIEKGYSIYLAETALLMFKNSMNQACAYIELFKQMQELGFNGEKIKEALVNTNNDREKALDILTASS